MKKLLIKQKRVLIVGCIIVVASAATYSGYLFSWTGFRGKTLWDWLGLLATFAIPIVVGFGVTWYTRTQQVHDQQLAERQAQTEREAAERQAQTEREAAERRAQTEREISINNQRESALQTYIDKLSELITAYNLRLSQPNSPVRAIARSRTLTMLRGLDVTRKANLLQFLYEAGLISRGECIIDLSGADLSGVILKDAYLKGVDLRGANLRDAKLERVELSEANLAKADLSGAEMHAAKLVGACLQKAYLSSSNMESADLSKANLSESYLENTNLAMANLEAADLSKAILSGASLFCAYLNKANLSSAYLGEFNQLVGADLSGAILWDAHLDKASLNDAYLITTDLRGANLSEANLKGAELIVADLREANLEKADLSQAFLNGAVVTKEQLAKALKLTDATLPDAQIIPEDAYPKGTALGDTELLTIRVARAVRLRGSGYARRLKHPNPPIRFITNIEDLLEMVKEPATEQANTKKGSVAESRVNT